MKKTGRILIVFFLFIFVINMFIGILCTTVYAGGSYATAEEIGYGETILTDVPAGDYWVKIRGENLSDLYISVNYGGAEYDRYTELYSTSTMRLAGDYTTNPKHFIVQRNTSDRMYYLKIHTPYEYWQIEINIERFDKSSGEHEPNNWFELATQMDEINTGVDIIFGDTLGNYDDFNGVVANPDIDIYKYTTSEPCMLAIKMRNYEIQADFEVYVDDFLIASTHPLAYKPIRIDLEDTFYFNHIKGSCYIVVFGGWGEYEMQITKLDYQPDPILYNVSPQNRQIISEFDEINPRVALLGEGAHDVSYYYYKNGNRLDSMASQNANSRSFTEYQFSTILPSQVSDEKQGTEQNTMGFSVRNITRKRPFVSMMYYLIYDNEPPECDDVIISKSEDSIEVKVLKAYDEVKLAQRPYRYRIYPSGTNPPEYTDWLTSSYYNQWINNKEIGNVNSYTIDVQIRDSVAEKYQTSTKDLSKHILTVIKTVSAY